MTVTHFKSKQKYFNWQVDYNTTGVYLTNDGDLLKINYRKIILFVSMKLNDKPLEPEHGSCLRVFIEGISGKLLQ
jgi:hypothetical protein